MGIKGLLPFVKAANVTKKESLRKFEGKRVAVDGHGWLHKGAYSCAKDLCLKRPTDKFVTFFLDRLKVLTDNGLVPIIVFDGAKLPMKKEVDKKRSREREKHLEKAKSATDDDEANKHFQRGVSITAYHVGLVIQALKEMQVEYVVAPYEADAQMAYLARFAPSSTKVELVLTEDSDLLAYACPDVLFKLYEESENEWTVDHVCFEELLKSERFEGFSAVNFTEMCVLAGCDYLKNLKGMGLKTAYEYMKEHKCHSAVIKSLREGRASKGKVFKVPSTYEKDFKRALQVFCHQTVYDGKRLRHLNPVRGDLCSSDLAFLGAHYSKKNARNVAEGIIHPWTFKDLPRESDVKLVSPNWFVHGLAAVLPLPEKEKKRDKKKKIGRKGDTSFHVESSPVGVPPLGEGKKRKRDIECQEEDIELKSEEVVKIVEPNPSQETVTRCKSVRMRLTKDQRKTILSWMHGARIVYNRALDVVNGNGDGKVVIKKLRPLVVKKWSKLCQENEIVRKTPYHIRDRALRDLKNAFKSNFEKLKKQKERGQRGKPFEVKHRSKRKMSSFTLTIDRMYLCELEEKERKVRRSRRGFCNLFPRLYPEMGPIHLSNKHVKLKHVGGAVKITRGKGEVYTMHIPYQVTPKKAEESSRVVALDPGSRTFQTFYGKEESGWMVGKCGEGAGKSLISMAVRVDKRIARVAKLEKEISSLEAADNDDPGKKLVHEFVDEFVEKLDRKIERAKESRRRRRRTRSPTNGGRNEKKEKKKRKNEKRIARVEKLKAAITSEVDNDGAEGARKLVGKLKRKLVSKLKRANEKSRKRARNLTNELHRKTACWLFDDYDMVLLPEFKVKGMIKKGRRKIRSKTARSLMSLRHYAFRQHMTQKAETRGKKLVIVDESLTSKTCGKCGRIDWKLKGAEEYKCPSCSYECGRDENAARNILLKNFRLKESSSTRRRTL